MMLHLNDENVQATNDDASTCKLFAVKLSYWRDSYVQYFARQTDHKPPEINRGYYVRMKAIDNIILQHFELMKDQFQVVNLGAGYDTRFWNLYDIRKRPLKWVELDFESIVRKKIHIIKSKSSLVDRLIKDGGIIESAQIHSSASVGYHLISADLRDTNSLETQILKVCQVDRSIPTLFIAECVLVYMKSQESTNLLRWISSNFSNCLFVNYEQVNINDRFGEVMLENLEKRGCPLLGHVHCASVKSQEERFLSCGWSKAQCVDMLQYYKNLSLGERLRVESLELLDDYEIVAQLFSHYCVVFAHKSSQQFDELFSTIKFM